MASVLSQISASAICRIASQTISFFYFLAIAIWVSKTDMGVYVFCLAAGQFATELTTLGTGPVIVRRIAARDAALEIVSAASIFQRLTFPLIFACIVLPVVIWSPARVEHLDLIALTFAACAVGEVAGIIKQILVAEQRFWHYAFAEQAGLFARVAAGLCLVYLGYGVFGLLLGLLLGNLVDALVSGRVVNRLLGLRLIPKWNRTEMAALLKEGLPLLALVIFNQALARADWLIMGVVRTPVETGEYAFAYRLFELSWLPHLILGPVLLPKLICALKRGEIDAAFSERLARLAKILVVISVVIPLCMGVGWTPVVQALTNGKYGRANEFIFLILSMSVPFAAATCLFWSLAIALKKTSTIMTASSIGGFLNVGLNVALVPYFGGLGAAYAAIIGMIVQFSIYAWLLRHSFPLRASVTGPLLSLAAGIAAFAVGHALPLHWLGQAVLSLSLYLASVPFIAAMSPAEIGAMWEWLRRGRPAFVKNGEEVTG